MRAMDALTQNLIDSLTQILKDPQEESLQALKICAPVLIDHLKVVKDMAVDRREIQSQLHKALDQWLKHHPQPESAQEALITLLDQELLAKQLLKKEASA
ncbi:hypothetical protein V2K64_19785 [Pseudomonas alliivorans]|nr:hypothetical protein [Pseudomonas alliivorans]MEE4891004.1 hypothetical protein [Pseudomonas alliivorans]